MPESTKKKKQSNKKSEKDTKKTDSVLEFMVKFAIQVCNDNRYMYSNSYPNNTFGMLENDPYPYLGDCGAFCSFCLNNALKTIGIESKEYFEPAGSYPPINEAFLLKYCNVASYTGPDSLKAGDILVAAGHTEMYIGNGQLAGAHGNIGIAGPNQVSVGGFYDDGWLAVYRLKEEFGGKSSGSFFHVSISNLLSGTYNLKENKPIEINTKAMSKEELNAFAEKYAGYKTHVKYEDVSVTKTFSGIKEVSGNVKRVNSTKLLSYPSLVESPFIILRVGDFSFGTYTVGGDLNKIANVTFPNFIKGAQIQKVNGTVNQYTIELDYQIEAGNDPNLVDKILSKVGYGLVYISYGDWSCPTFVYKEEEALIVNVTSEVNFSRSLISYKITCTSNSISLISTTFNFPAKKAKPSDIIFKMLSDSSFGLQNFFPGMSNLTKVKNKSLIATNDIAVDLNSKEGMDPVSYLNYLVSCMTSSEDATNKGLKSSVYYLTIHDDSKNDLGGAYFKVEEVKAQGDGGTITTADTYEIDVGFPSENEVVNFRINDNNSWSLLYDYAEKVDNQKYVYKLNDEGIIETTYSPNITTSTTDFKTTELQRTWWTNMTRFPITAELEIKGLIRPAMLMSYIRVNAFFYGQRHISSGLYVITKQIDTINETGYRTLLTLLRIGGDNDYITSITKTFTTKAPRITTEKDIEGFRNLVLSGNEKEVKDNSKKTSSSDNFKGGGGGRSF